MRHHRTVGPPSKPGHGRGSAPYEPSDSTSRPWGGASWTVENNAPVANRSLWNMAWHSLKHGVTLSGTSLFNIAGAALVTSLPARRSYLNFVSTPTKPTIYSKARRHNIKEQRAERLRTKGKLSVTSRGSSHISRVSTREHPETHEPTHVVPRAQRPEQRIWRKQTTSNLLLVNKQVHSN